MAGPDGRETDELGAHLQRCDHCSHETIAFNSCRNRHCPKCQAGAREKWLAARSRELLPVPYCHVVFTLPAKLSTLALRNPQVVYNLFFQAVAETLLTIAADPRLLGARIGFLAVLHTWNQKLLYHPHLHCLIPAGGISRDGTRWLRSRKRFFLPVRVLGRMFRGKFLALLGAAFRKKNLRFPGFSMRPPVITGGVGRAKLDPRGGQHASMRPPVITGGVTPRTTSPKSS